MYVSEILGKLMIANMDNQLAFEIQDYMSPAAYAREFKTIRVNYGRRTGKTTAIKDFVGFGDVVFAHSYLWKRELEKYILPINYNLSVLTYHDTQRLDFTLGKKNNFRVWIDEATLFGEEQIQAVQEMLASRTTQFILLG